VVRAAARRRAAVVREQPGPWAATTDERSSSGARAAAAPPGDRGGRRGEDPEQGRPSGADGPSAAPAERTPSEVAGEDVARRVVALLDELAAIDTDACTDGQLRALLQQLKAPQDRLTALRSRWAGELEHRAILAAPPGKQQRAVQDARRALQSDLRLTPSEAKQTSEVGRRLRDAPEARRALDAGELSQAHAAVITDTLRHIPGARREAVEEELVALAGRLEVAAFRREATRILGREDLEAAEQQAERQLARRRVRVATREDGGVSVDAAMYGVGAELVRTAFEAFVTHDGEQERRTPEQRYADAFEQICSVALRAGEAPTQHGVRPHVHVVVQLTELGRLAGMAELGFTGPITLAEVRPLLQDASVTVVAVDDEHVPTHISEARRRVPAAVWKALAARDGRCTWPGCDAPMAWCDVAHGDHPSRLGGRLTLSNCALLCRRHHRRFDRGGWRMVVDGANVRYERDPTMPSVRERSLQDINGPP
jgi:hypothetical protein